MRDIIVLDSGPLGLLSNPRKTPQTEAAKSWLRDRLQHNALVVIPGITDYEVRRELILHHKINGLARLDALKSVLRFIPIDDDIMLHAAQLWAQARQRGRPTAEATALDGDVILAASALAVAIRLTDEAGGTLVVATTNPKHLSQFVNAQEWQQIL